MLEAISSGQNHEWRIEWVMSPEDRTCLSCLETVHIWLVTILTEFPLYTEVSGGDVCS